jgi:hypothetical protein
MRRGVLGLGLGLLCSAACPAHRARAWSYDLAEPAVWKGALRYELQLPLSTALREALHSAVQTWRSAPCSPPEARFVGTTSRAPDVSLEGADGHSVFGFEERVWRYGVGVTAVTRVRARDGAINEADVLLNAVDFEWSSGPVPPDSPRLRQLAPTLLHEFGHVWGLGHSTDSDAIMHASMLHTRLGPDDIVGVCSLYPKTKATVPSAEQHTGFHRWAAALGIIASVVVFGYWRRAQRRQHA